MPDVQPNVIRCPCGGGQSCMVDRRALGDTVVIDDVMDSAGLPRLINCHDQGSALQRKVWKDYMTNFHKNYDSIAIR